MCRLPCSLQRRQQHLELCVTRGLFLLVLFGHAVSATVQTSSCGLTESATDGAAYEQQMGRWSRRLAEPFLDFAELDDGGQILDLGCGTGSLTLALAGRLSTSRIVGLDASGAYIDHAQRYISNPRIEFHVGDACAMPFPDASFDHVLSMLVLPFVPNTADALAEIRRVARPGAVVAAAGVRDFGGDWRGVRALPGEEGGGDESDRGAPPRDVGGEIGAASHGLAAFRATLRIT